MCLGCGYRAYLESIVKILKVIHGYPPRFNAGAEVYGQMLCRELAKRHKVDVFTRSENPFIVDYSLSEEKDGHVTLHVINLPLEKHRYRHSHARVDEKFQEILKKIAPDVIHIGHLNHLSLTLVNMIPETIPIIYTVHDYWLICPRGQFIQRHNDQDLWALCDKQEDEKCALHCYSGYFSGIESELEEDRLYWASWVNRRKVCIHQILERVNYFICPSRYLLDRFRKSFPALKQRFIYLDYGFDLNRLTERKRELESCFTFGYIFVSA